MAITVIVNAQAKTLPQLEVLNWIAQDVQRNYFHLSYQTTTITINEIYYNRFTQAWHIEGRMEVKFNNSVNPEYDNYSSAWSTSTTRKRMKDSSGS